MQFHLYMIRISALTLIFLFCCPDFEKAIHKIKPDLEQ
jgi:hypothetical protein